MAFGTVNKHVYTYLGDKFQTDPFGGLNSKKSQGYSPCFLMNFKQYFQVAGLEKLSISNQHRLVQ